ncbi:RagB/SusD family nutrient uptake outer membrane protein [Urechidicola vernalis]|uniref:RagB/SusD family nutrient uptake outer membrane protein n=1 Tax=Urechidicola vernalis TaxID=3075600 RepID=A0ABU2Y5W0_9FLAO|nr:RagB/SusD family nutrient uptake outer membrane protein [Urechidicola sp. P050]MDT0553576.1 RagB/SusD family nutrient uptake outer membrane protein [Urechidicola sp. P050]
MKKGLIYVALLFGVLACSDEFTQSPAVGALSDEALKNETGVNLLLTGAYSTLDGQRANGFGNGWSVSGDNWIYDVVSDDAHKGSTDDDQADLKEVELFNWATGNGYFYGKWGVIFAGINRANAVIALIATIEEGDFSAQLAEARFLRGHFNFELQKAWGNVPYISDENYAATEFNQPNPGPIWDQIEADFKYALDNLPDTQDVYGRPTTWTATAFLGKAHLYQQEWTDALTYLETVINLGPYSLMPDYVDNFRLAGDNSTESIFSIQFAADSGQSYNGNSGGALNFPNPGPFGSCCGFYQPTQDLLNAFQTTAGGTPLLDTYNQTDVTSDYGINSDETFTPFAGNLDPRADYTVGRRGIDYNGYGEHIGKDWIRAGFSDISGPYLPKKNVYWDGESDNQATGGWGQQLSGINYHIMRYADVLLMAAEAEVESGGSLANALTYVNRVRERAKNSNYMQATDGSGDAATYVIQPYASFPDADFARKAVRFERRIELGMEGHRLFDIRRWGNSVQHMNDYFTNEARTITNFGTKVNAYTSTFDLFPIPISAIDLSGGILTQNPGY